MKTKYKILLVLLSLSLIASLYIAQSYALWSYTAPQTSTNSVNSGCFNITYTDTGSSSLNLLHSFPISDTDALRIESPYTFTITNSCSINTEYTVTLNVINTSTLDAANIKYALVPNNDSNPTAGKFLSSAPINSDTNNYDAKSTIKTSYKLASGVLAQNGTAKFKLYLWIKEEATDSIKGQTFTSAVYVNNVPTNKGVTGATMSE